MLVHFLVVIIRPHEIELPLTSAAFIMIHVELILGYIKIYINDFYKGRRCRSSIKTHTPFYALNWSISGGFDITLHYWID